MLRRWIVRGHLRENSKKLSHKYAENEEQVTSMLKTRSLERLYKLLSLKWLEADLFRFLFLKNSIHARFRRFKKTYLSFQLGRAIFRVGKRKRDHRFRMRRRVWSLDSMKHHSPWPSGNPSCLFRSRGIKWLFLINFNFFLKLSEGQRRVCWLQILYFSGKKTNFIDFIPVKMHNSNVLFIRTL